MSNHRRKCLLVELLPDSSYKFCCLLFLLRSAWCSSASYCYSRVCWRLYSLPCESYNVTCLWSRGASERAYSFMTDWLGACYSYFRGDAKGCPKLLMTDQILCLPNEAKCVENWSPIYANKPQPPTSRGELMSLECVRLRLRMYAKSVCILFIKAVTLSNRSCSH